MTDSKTVLDELVSVYKQFTNDAIEAQDQIRKELNDIGNRMFNLYRSIAQPTLEEMFYAQTLFMRGYPRDRFYVEDDILSQSGKSFFGALVEHNLKDPIDYEMFRPQIVSAVKKLMEICADSSKNPGFTIQDVIDWTTYIVDENIRIISFRKKPQ